MDKKALLEQFEALPLMVAILNDSFIYVDQTNEYAHPNLEDNRVTLGYVNGAWYAFQHQQAKVEELQTLYTQQGLNMLKLQKRVDAVKQLIQDYLDEEKELELKEWEQSTIYGRIAIELEQALKGGEA